MSGRERRATHTGSQKAQWHVCIPGGCRDLRPPKAVLLEAMEEEEAEDAEGFSS